MYNPHNTIESLAHIKCTGCGACKNVCPVDAISMGEDSEFFVYPIVDPDICINCGKCKSICPAIEPRYLNKGYEPKIFAAKAEDQEREISSSGGVFGLLAKATLAEGGLVCGAVFGKDFKVEHTLTDTNEGVARMRGSKYVQSDTHLIYREIGEALRKGKSVLFTGCPCQVAGLRGYLEGKNTQNLLCADLLCHGFPSANSLARYLEEIAKGKTIAKVDFRDKKMGWRSDKIKIEFEDGSVYESDSLRDPYVKGFVRNLTLRPSCSDCPFCEYPRQGDITLGDFWGVSRLMPGAEDPKGVSLVMLNNKKGEKAFETIQKDLIFYEPYQGAKTSIPNRIKARYPANPLRPRFFQINRKKQFTDAVNAVAEGQYDVGLVCNYLAENFGGSLTQYALYRFLEDNGYSVLMIERPLSAEGRIPKPFLFYKEKPYPDYSLAPRYQDRAAMRALNQKCAAFVVGSDQLFQYELYRLLGKFTTLDWVADNRKKIAYAASFGHDVVWGNKDEIQRMGYFMRKFDAFSVREKSGLRITREVFGFESEWVLDPVFLCEKKHYDALIEKSGKTAKKKYIGAYILDPSLDKRKVIERAMETLRLPCEIFTEFAYREGYAAPFAGLRVVPLTMEERLANIKQCEFFVTDSFHGTCLAILMGKPFLTIKNKGRGGSRFDTLLGHFGLAERLLESSKDLESKANPFDPIDYSSVTRIIKEEVARCSAWLLSALEQQKYKGFSGYDIVSQDLSALSDELIAVRKKLDFIVKKTDLQLMLTNDLHAYLDILKKNSGKYTVLIAVKDTPGLALNEDTAKRIKGLGLQVDLSDKHWRAYAAVIDDGKDVFERLSPDESPVFFEGFPSGIRAYIESRPLRNGNLAKIMLNGKDYSVNKRGLNIVVWNKKKGEVEDTVCFDTHVPTYTAYRVDIG
ncbi:MAG: polysaccharide pyruvyl transferase family protein [Clostridia bacterium]|nr:polysaccharide pyruvyl transferase family protein [Clostridia bacterium]